MTAIAADLTIAARLHLQVLDQLTAVVKSHMAEAAPGFARESLGDLLDSFAEQRQVYAAVAAAAQPVAVKLAA